MSLSRTLKTLTLVGLVSLILVPVAGAATWTVHADGSGDFPTIQVAVLSSSNGDVIELTPGTYTGPGNTDVNITDLMITLRSQSGLPGQVFIDCNANSSDPRRGLLVVGDGCSGTLIEGLTIINGYGYQSGIVSAGALLIKNFASPMVRNCVFENNHSGMEWNNAGGAVYVDSHCDATFEGCEFRGNSAFFGGAVGVNHYSTAEFFDCQFLDNTGGRGGAIWGNSTNKTSCLFARNDAEEGGAIWGNGYNDEYSANCTYSGNSAPVGGAIYALPNYGAPVILIDSIIADCLEGEAIWAPAGIPVELSCSDLYGNAGGDWIGTFASQVDQDGNFSANPCFCSPDTDEFTICEDSFCLPGHHPWGCDQLVGAFGIGCGECSCSGPVSTDKAYLGSIKAMYRR